MSSHNVIFVGGAIVLFGAMLELRHLIKAITRQFEDCDSVSSVWCRALALDDAMLLGVLACAALACALVMTLANDLTHADHRPDAASPSSEGSVTRDEPMQTPSDHDNQTSEPRPVAEAKKVLL